MKQGKFGICLAFYAILAFVLAVAGQPLLCGVLLGFVVLAEGDRWTARQVLQGFMLSLVVKFFSGISYTVGSLASMPFRVLFGWYNYDFANTVESVFSFIVFAGAAVLSVLAILRLSRGQEANVPLLSNLAYHVYGEKKPRPVKHPAYPQPNYPQPMVQYPPQQGQPVPPVQGQPGVPQPPVVQAYPAPPQPQVMPDLQQTAQIPVPMVQTEQQAAQQPPQQQ